MDYTKYSVEDLASDDSFIQWANRNNSEAEKFWALFILEHPEMRVKAAQARILVLNLRKAEALRQPESQIDAMWQRIENRVERSRIPYPDSKKVSFFSYAVAAVSLIFIAAAAWYTFYNGKETFEPSVFESGLSGADFIEEVNTSGNILRVHLSDGSTVALENNSRLKYKTGYRGEPSRVVYLAGEAFFEVAKNPIQPFLVHANEVVTRVLGTSFRVKAPDNDLGVIVSVKTGTVSVYAVDSDEPEEESRKNAVILLPNQQVTYLRDQDSFGKALVPAPEIVLPSIRQSDFAFENTPIRDAFQVLQKAYGIEIIFDEEIMENCFITAPLGSEPLFEKLGIICRTIGARYEIIDARVVITSAGC